MVTIEEKDIKDVVEQIVALKRTIPIEGDHGQAGLNAIFPDDGFKDVLTGDGQFNLDAWTQIPNDKKLDRYKELQEIRDLLMTISPRNKQPQINSAAVPSPDGLARSSGNRPSPALPLDGPNDLNMSCMPPTHLPRRSTGA